MFAIESALPLFYSTTDGYLGLGLGTAYGATEEEPLNTLDQMIKHGMIGEKKFGVCSISSETEEVHSTIRFGGVDEEMFGDNMRLYWIPTVASDSWMIEIHALDFHGDAILGQASTAIINPGYPYIAAPLADFQKLVEDIETNYAGTGLTCDTGYGYCTFTDDCDALADIVPPLTFFLGPEHNQRHFTIPSSSFLHEEMDEQGNPIPQVCHLGVIGQIISDTDHWVLGDAFTQNFYVAFDATQGHPHVGITLEEHLHPADDATGNLPGGG